MTNPVTVRLKSPPRLFWVISGLLVGLFYGLAALRHTLLNSGGLDLGIFDQVAWQMSQGLEPRSTLTGLHHMADHAAWVFYAITPLYWLKPSVHWLFLTQSAGLILTAWPLWHLAVQAGLKPRERWTVCGLYWLQAMVFNVNLWDFRPDAWAMPFLALAIWANRAERRWLWIACLFLAMGCREVLSLIVVGFALEQALRQRWRWAAEALFLGIGWLFFVIKIINPIVKDGAALQGVSRYHHLGDSVGDILQNALFSPEKFLGALDWPDIVFYLFLLSLPLGMYWRRASFPMLTASLPLIVSNVLSDYSIQRNLIQHYSLPLAVLLVVASMDGLAADLRYGRLWLAQRCWIGISLATLCWALLIKPGYWITFKRIDQVQTFQALIKQIPADAGVLSHNHYISHLSQRPVVQLLRENFPLETATIVQQAQLDGALLNPNDPAWPSSSEKTAATIEQLKAMSWDCEEHGQSGFVLCRKPTS
ncbi:MAG: DUF2079 domain-containing protein [Cyanobacteria bacterium MAG CAR4_bin_6]|nr:DUF2079 domain-containing protein [Cyanobacteria bacterium MAG CAR4_bin_6]